MRLEVVKGGGSLMGRKGRELVMNERVGGRRSVEKKGGKSWAIRAIGTSRNRWKMARGVGGRLEGVKESGSWMGREGRGLAMNRRVGGCRSVEKKKKVAGTAEEGIVIVQVLRPLFSRFHDDSHLLSLPFLFLRLFLQHTLMGKERTTRRVFTGGRPPFTQGIH